MKDFYTCSNEHLYDELLLIDFLIQYQVVKYKAEHNTPQDNFKGLYISEAEIQELLLKKSSTNDWVYEIQYTGDDYDEILEIIKTQNSNIRTKIRNSLQKGILLKFVKIIELYNLTEFESNILSVCLAPEFSSKYRKFFGYLQNDVTRKNPGIELILDMYCANFEEKIAARKYFSPQAALFKNNIIQSIDDPREQDKPLIARDLKINSRITNYILSEDFIDDDIALLSEINQLQITLNDISLPDKIKEKFQNFMNYFRTAADCKNFVFSFYGVYGSQKLESAAAICNELGIKLLIIDLSALNSSGIHFERAIDLILREAKIIPAALFFKNCDFLFTNINEESYYRKYFLDEINKISNLSFLESRYLLPIHGEFDNQRVISIELPVPDYLQRKELWEYHLKKYELGCKTNIIEIANKYNLTAGQIKDIVNTASSYALWRDSKNIIINQKDIEEACHIHSNQKLSQLTQRVQPKHNWDDIILTDTIKEKLKELIDMFKNKHIVYNYWGFHNKLSLGKGISALFYGEPGTGKTLACEIIAYELGMDLYKIDISTIVSKYVGETEKNLSNIFEQAECSNAILFFDEADAIFGKRTEVRDAHDKYANIETSYLLQRIDEYNGVVILATNFSKNIDPAFERRLHFSINFPFPDENSRLEIWKHIFPKETPLANDINFTMLAKELTVSGGNIKNIALLAAFYTAEAHGMDGIITMEHIMQAAKSEFEKIGRVWYKNSGY